MLILFRKHLFWFSFIFIYLINTTTFLPPYMCEFPYLHHKQSIPKKSRHRPLRPPHQQLRLRLLQLHYRPTQRQSHLLRLCLGDLEPALCTNCVNDSIVKLRELCPNQTESIGYYDDCFLKYSNETGKLGPSLKMI
ncbi:putative Gnk2-like domain-containing protein [Helianthus annuus]|nr:putative Gnk2-like domain-containing protein [Helianthus annuus]KAJ0822324.1 putative Gnk2-like domain-containing protein [Helianthus annuus]